MSQTHLGWPVLSPNVLIVGSNGFLGSNLALFFEANDHNVVRISRADGDLELPSTWQRLDVDMTYDAIFFCAERSGNQAFFEKNFSHDISCRNLQVLLNLESFLEKLKSPSKIFFFNSLWSAPRSCAFISEEDLFSYEKDSNVSGLMISKIHILELAKKINTSNFPHEALVITTGTLFGPGDKSDHLIPSILRQLILKPEKLKLSGGPSSVRNYFYIGDLSRCLLSLINHQNLEDKSIIISSNVKLSIGAVVNTLAHKFNVSQIEWGNKIDNFSERIPNTSLFKKKYKPETLKFRLMEDFDIGELRKWV